MLARKRQLRLQKEEARRRAEEKELAKQKQQEEQEQAAAAAAAQASTVARPLASRLNNASTTSGGTIRGDARKRTTATSSIKSGAGVMEAAAAAAGALATGRGGIGGGDLSGDHKNKKARYGGGQQQQEEGYRGAAAASRVARAATTTTGRGPRRGSGVPEDVAVQPPIDPSPLSSVAFSQSPPDTTTTTTITTGTTLLLPPSSSRIPNKSKKRSLDDNNNNNNDGMMMLPPAPPNNNNNKASVTSTTVVGNNNKVNNNNNKPKLATRPSGPTWSNFFGDDSSDDDFDDSDDDDDVDGSPQKKVAAKTKTTKPTAAAATANKTAEVANKKNNEKHDDDEGGGDETKVDGEIQGSQSSENTSKRSTYFQRQREDAASEQAADNNSGSNYLGKAHRNSKVHNNDIEDNKTNRSSRNNKNNIVNDMDTSESESDGEESDDEATPYRRRRSRTSTSSRSSSSSTPRNPLALMRAQQHIKYERKTTTDAAAATALEDTPPGVAAAANSKAQPHNNNNNNHDDGLWSSDEDDVVIPAASSRSPKKQKRAATAAAKAKKKKAPPVSSTTDSGSDMDCDLNKKPAPKKNGKNNKKRAKTRLDRDFQEELSDDEEYEVDPEEAKARLIPIFDEPKFGPFAFEAFPLEVIGTGEGRKGDDEFEVPASISRYLPIYQQEGIQFMFQNILENYGVILGDDMGLGKTVQVIALLSALLQKTGTYLDSIAVKRRVKFVTRRLYEYRRKKQEMLDQGEILTMEEFKIASEVPGGLPDWSPVLIIVPPSVSEHWQRDFATWGHFGVSVYETGSEQENSLQRVRHGASEILICTRSCFQQEHTVHALCDIEWKLVIIDEFHVFKNEKAKISKNLRMLKEELEESPVIVGLTGTLMQNNHGELWNLIDLAEEDFLGPWKEFKTSTANPIKSGRAVDADEFTREIGEQKAREFKSQISALFLERKKENVLRDELPEKEECIVFCELSEMQKQVYQYTLEQPDFVLVSHANAPCGCGVNNKYQLEYTCLSTLEQRRHYMRHHEFKKRGDCCHKKPKDKDSPDGIAPNAVLWKQRDAHDGGACKYCPYCIAFPCLHILTQLSSHIALLQAGTDPDMYEEGSKDHEKAVRELEKAQAFLPPEIVRQLPGRSYVRGSNAMDDHFSLSGKMKVLNTILRDISRDQGRVLLFSAYTQTLDLIENYAKTHYKFLRMDGSTPQRKRQLLADEFSRKPEIFMFLLSTKAMGTGLNLSSANYVIMFDVDWNPANDAQAQDRAYRIGQDKDVKVFRLVSRGTVEELKFLRQLYKTDLKTETLDLENPEAEMERRFRGVDGDKDRKGELFGLTNLLKYKDGIFKPYKSTASSSIKPYGAGVYRMEDLKAAVQKLSEEEFDEIGGGGLHNMLVTTTTNHWSKPKRRLHQLEEGDEDDDNDNTGEAQTSNGSDAAAPIPHCRAAAEEDNESSDEDEYIGGETQNNLNILEARAAYADGVTSDNPDMNSVKEEEDDEEEDPAGAFPTTTKSAHIAPEPDEVVSSSAFHQSCVPSPPAPTSSRDDKKQSLKNTKAGNVRPPPSKKQTDDLMKEIMGKKKRKNRKKQKN